VQIIIIVTSISMTNDGSLIYCLSIPLLFSCDKKRICTNPYPNRRRQVHNKGRKCDPGPPDTPTIKQNKKRERQSL